MTPNEYIAASEELLRHMYPDGMVPLETVMDFMREVRNCAARLTLEVGVVRRGDQMEMKEATEAIADMIRPPDSMRAWMPYRKLVEEVS